MTVRGPVAALAAPLAVAMLLGAGGPAAGATPTDEELARSVVPMVLPVEELAVARSITPLARRAGGTRVAVPADVLFGFDRASVRSASRRALLRLTTSLVSGSGTLRVTGHTDGIGGSAYNRRLSLVRARAVAAVLRSSLRPGIRVVAVGRGATRPVAAERTPDGRDDPDGRARNRRVELRFAPG